MTQQRRILLPATIALLLLAALWAYRQMGVQRTAAVRAEGDLLDCRAMADQIRQCKDRPALALERERGSSEINSLIDSTAKAAGISGSLAQITPERPRHIGDTDYMEQPIISKEDVDELLDSAISFVDRVKQHCQEQQLA